MIDSPTTQQIDLGIKDFCTGYGIPEKHIWLDHWPSMMRDETTIRLRVLMSSNLSERRNEGELPATLQDWIKLYAGKLLGWMGIKPSYRTIPITHTSVYNVCPHVPIPEECLWKRDSYVTHQVFMFNGPDIKDLGPALSKAANEIVQAVLYDYAPEGSYCYKSRGLLRAVRRYKDIAAGKV